jgi:hypothetical protein
MSMLVSAGITQCMNFYSIKDDQKPSEVGAGEDFFVGPNVDITLTIPNGQTIQVRDIVVLGKLSIKSTNLDHSSAKGSLVAHDIFAPGNLEMNYVNVECRNMYQPKNVQQFRQELQDKIIDWFKFQKESAEKIGLKSILI